MPGIPRERILEARPLAGGAWVLREANGKGSADFKVVAFDEGTQRRFTPSYAHLAVDLYGKLLAAPRAAAILLAAVEEISGGASAFDVYLGLTESSSARALGRLRGYSTEFIVHALELIFAQEDANWSRGPDEPIPPIRQGLIKKGALSQEEARIGRGLALAFLRRVVRDRTHPIEAMPEVGLQISRLKRR